MNFSALVGIQPCLRTDSSASFVLSTSQIFEGVGASIPRRRGATFRWLFHGGELCTADALRCCSW